MAAIMDGGVDEALLATGAVFHTGGCDKTGHPLMIFPTSQQSALTNMPASDLILLLSYMRRIVPAQQQPTGFTYLANLQSAGQKTITQLITCLNTIQMTADTEAQVHCLYVIKPKASKNVKILEKLAGLKPSKKNPVKNLYQVHMLKDFASLHRSIDKVALTEEFGGHQQFNIASWVQFRLQVDKITTEVERCQSLLEEARDQMNILCELEIPAGLDESQPLLDSINSKYNAVMGQLQLEHVIDNCGSILDELNSPKVQTKYAQGDLLRELIKYTRTSQRELTEAREQLQLLWKQALARVVQACQLRVHQKNAKKILKWIGRNGMASIKELTQPVSNREQVVLLLDKVKVLTASIQDVQKEADYIQTDVEYMALQDLSEFSSSLKAIETMRAELDLFNISLSNSQDRLGSACTVFTNVAKCYQWYEEFLTSLPRVTDSADFFSACSGWFSEMEQNCPPKEWLIYIESKLACVDNEQYRGNAVALIKRIRKIQVENGGKLSLLAVNRWIAALEDGFDGLTKSLTPVQQNNPSAQSPIRKKSLQSSRKFGAPKLRRSRDVIDSSTDDIEGTVPARSKRPTRSRRSPPSKEVSVQEAYIDLTRSVKVPLLPQSLSHVNLEKFLENEPTDTVLASSIPADGLEQRIEKETKLGKINIEESVSADNSRLFRLIQTGRCPDVEKVPSSTNTFLMSFSALSKNKRKKKKYRVRQEDDTDDSCPTPIDHLSASGAVVASPCSPSGTNNSLVVPQNYELPYHPIDHKKKLEQIYRSSSPTLEQKLDMMASLIEDGDESYFHVEPVDSSIGVADRIETVGVNNVECTNQVGRLTPGNISRELSADVTHSEHIYHWLRRQNNENFISREIQEDEEGENNSLKECIQRAEKILQEDIPNCSNNHVQHQHFNGQSPEDLIRGNNDVISKSGDSGITELTTRDTILSNSHHRYASKESGLESDITGYTMTSSEHNTRPRQVPPLWLNKSYTRAFRTPQHSRASRHQQSMPLAETVTAVTP